MDIIDDILNNSTIAALLSAIFVSYIGYKYVWKSQKLGEWRAEAMREAVRALSLYEKDVTDYDFQQQVMQGPNNTKRLINTRLETDIQQFYAEGLVKAFYSFKTFNKFTEAMKFITSTEIRMNRQEHIAAFKKKKEGVVYEMSNDE